MHLVQPETEIALDYQPALLAAAARALTSSTPSDPAFVSVQPGTKVTPAGRPTDAAYPGGGGQGGQGISSGGLAAAIVVPIVVVLIAALALVWYLRRRGKLGTGDRRSRGRSSWLPFFDRSKRRRGGAYAATPVADGRNNVPLKGHW
jgi:hypothetical protein